MGRAAYRVLGEVGAKRRFNAPRDFSLKQTDNKVVSHTLDYVHRLTLPPVSASFGRADHSLILLPWQATFSQMPSAEAARGAAVADQVHALHRIKATLQRGSRFSRSRPVKPFSMITFHTMQSGDKALILLYKNSSFSYEK
jgi:hypothetical protein